MNLCEPKEESKIYKIQYLDEISKLLEERMDAAQKARAVYCRELFTDAPKYRKKVAQILGWPLTGYEKTPIGEADVRQLGKEGNHTVYRLQIEVLPGLKLTGLFFESENRKRPLIIAQHGGMGTPERTCGFYGTTYNYNHMAERILQYDCSVFAPQLLLWDTEEYGVEFDRASVDAQLKAVGSSITAIEVYGIMRSLDYFESRGYGSFGMVGLSYGGFFTLYTAALDTRIQSAIVSCYFNRSVNRKEKQDWQWFEHEFSFGDAELACLVYPRRLYIQAGIRDELLPVDGAKAEYNRLIELCEPVGTDWLSFLAFDGTHQFCKDDSYIKQMVEDLLNSGD